MSKLNAALLIGALVLVTGASDAQAAKIKYPLWDFGKIFGVGTPDQILQPPSRIPAIDLGGDHSGDGGGDGDGKKPPITIGERPDGDWSTEQADNPSDGEWHTETGSPDEPQWTVQTATRP